MMRSWHAALVLSAFLSAGAADATAYTATPDNFAQIFMSANSGDTIKLSGSFGFVTLANKSFAVPLRIDASAATFSDTLLLNNISGVAFTGGYFGSNAATRYNKAVAMYASSSISFNKAYVTGVNSSQGIAVVDSTGITVSNSTFDGLHSGVAIGNTTGAVLYHNVSIHAGSDGFDIAGSHDVSVTNSRCSNGAPVAGAHPDCVQLFSIAGNPPQSDITITDNVAYGPTQGFTSFTPENGGGLRIDISRNLVQTSYPQGIACYACVDSVFTNNTLTTLPGSQYRTNINIVGGADNLIFNNTRDGAEAPDQTDPLSISELPADLAEEVAWTPSGFGHDQTLAEWGVPIASDRGMTVPEPGAWAMMLAGFGAIGGALRRRSAHRRRPQAA